MAAMLQISELGSQGFMPKTGGRIFRFW